MEYLLIVIAKVVEITLATIRIVLITKGERKIGAIIGFFEVTIWIIVVSQVLSNIASDPLKIVAYALGFALGNYFGSIAEEKIGIGTSQIECIVSEGDGEKLTKHIREEGFAVTVVPAQGMHDRKMLLLMFIPRKKVRFVVQLIMSVQPAAVITVSESKPLYGGHGVIKK